MVDFKALAAPFPPEEVSWRLGSVSKAKMQGMALAYLDARNVMDRLDDVCGPDGWQAVYPHAHAKTVCNIGIWCGPERGWVYKANGAGDTDIEGEKGAMSDAMKRAAVCWGIGRYLYSLKSPWVEIEEIGQTGKFRIKAGAYKELDMVLRRATQAILNPVAKPQDGLALAKNDIAQQQNATGKPIEPLKSAGRLAAEKYAAETLDQFGWLNSATLRDWYTTPATPKGTKTNGDKITELREKHPDLADKIDAAAEEVRLGKAA